MRNRLIELLKQMSCVYAPCDRECGECHNVEMYDDSIESIADHLLAEGVIVPLVKNSQTVYTLDECSCENIDGVHTECEYYGYGEDDRICKCETKCPYVFRIEPIFVTEYNKIHISTSIGKTVFLTKEEAEKALEERKANDGT